MCLDVNIFLTCLWWINMHVFSFAVNTTPLLRLPREKLAVSVKFTGNLLKEKVNQFELAVGLDWFQQYRKTPGTQTLRGNKKQFEFAGNLSHQGEFQCNFDQGNGNLVWVSGEYKLFEFELSRFYCINRKSWLWQWKICAKGKCCDVYIKQFSELIFLSNVCWSV